MATNNNSSSSIGTTLYRSRLPSSHSLHTDMNVVGGRWTVATPFCRCNHYCVLKIAKTRINYGHQFWGCGNYMVFSYMKVVVIFFQCFCNCVTFFQLCFLNLFFFIYKFKDLMMLVVTILIGLTRLSRIKIMLGHKLENLKSWLMRKI
jgi:hypothetical protein